MIAGKTFTLRTGMTVRYKGTEYTVVNFGSYGVRLFRAPDSHLVVPASEIEAA